MSYLYMGYFAKIPNIFYTMVATVGGRERGGGGGGGEEEEEIQKFILVWLPFGEGWGLYPLWQPLLMYEVM